LNRPGTYRTVALAVLRTHTYFDITYGGRTGDWYTYVWTDGGKKVSVKYTYDQYGNTTSVSRGKVFLHL